MNELNYQGDLQNLTKQIIIQTKKLEIQNQQQNQYQNQPISSTQILLHQPISQNTIKNKSKKNHKKSNKKNNENKKSHKIIQNTVSIKNSLKKHSQKANFKRIKTQSQVQNIQSIEQSIKFPQIDENKKCVSKSTSKKTIVSQKNLILKPFESKISFDEDESDFKFFGSLDRYVQEFSNNKSAIKKQVCFWKVAQEKQRQLNPQIGSRFLSSVVRKSMDSEQKNEKNKVQQNQSAINNAALDNRKKNQSQLQGQEMKNMVIFQNDKVSKYLQESLISSQTDIIKKPLNRQKNNDIHKIFRIKTEIIRSAKNTYNQHQHQEVRQNNGNGKSYQNELQSNNFINYQFIPACSSSLARSQHKQIEDADPIFMRNDVIHQCYRNIKSKSKKLLRYSLIRQPNLSLLVDKSKNSKKSQFQSNSVKQLIAIEKRKHKLPLIVNRLVSKQKKIQHQKSPLLNSIYQYKKNQNAHQRVDTTPILMQNFKKYSNHLQTQNIKEKLRSYIELQTPELIMNQANQQHKLSSESTKSLTPINLFNQKFIKKSISSKIIQNFHKNHYQNHNSKTKSKNKISNLNMSENFILNFRDSIDWQQRKKLIIKKLGIVL